MDFAGNFISILLGGLSAGTVLFIVSVGLSVTMGLMGFVNLAHGAFAMFGGYVIVLAMNPRMSASARLWRWVSSPPRRSASCSSGCSIAGSTAPASLTRFFSPSASFSFSSPGSR